MNQYIILSAEAGEFGELLINTQLAVLLLLIVAAASAIGFKRLHFPYTIGLLIVGLLLGFVGENEIMTPLRSLSLFPEVIMFVFLPVLIFESAYNLDNRLLLRNIVPVMVLAIPGMLLSTAIAGSIAGAMTPLSWGEAFLFGALISATDPVAVIALFKELGAPKRLMTLVEGESLFNDATAIVVFSLIYNRLSSGGYGGGFELSFLLEGISRFAVVFAGGLLVGLVLGYALISLIPLGRGNPSLQVMISIALAYIAFIVAEHYLHVSGVMSVVGAGVMVGWLGSIRYSPETRESVKEFWEFAAFLANSLIFLLVGLALAEFIRELSEGGTVGDLTRLSDFIVPIAAAIFAVLVARAIVIMVMIPLVSKLPGNEPVGWRYQTVMFWGGLRGAVALALGLSLEQEAVDKELIIILTLGVVLFTVIGSGSTMGRLIHALKLDQPSLADRIAKAEAWLAAKREALTRVTKMARGGHFSDRLMRKLRGDYRQAVADAENNLQSLRANASPGKYGSLRQIIWFQAFNIEQKAYLEMYNRGSISESVMRELELTVLLKRDDVKSGKTPSRSAVAMPLDIEIRERLSGIIDRIAPSSRWAERHRLEILTSMYECDAALAEAASHVAEEMQFQSLMLDTETDIISECREQYQRLSITAMQRLDKLAEDWPQYILLLQQRSAQFAALEGEIKAVEHLADEGDIPETVADEVRHTVEGEQYSLMSRPAVPVSSKPKALLKEVPMFKHLEEADLEKVLAKLSDRTVLAGENIVSHGDSNPSLVMVASGIIAILDDPEHHISKRSASLHPGEYYGAKMLVLSKPCDFTLQAATDARTIELAKQDLLELAESNPGIKTAWEEAKRKEEVK